MSRPYDESFTRLSPLVGLLWAVCLLLGPDSSAQYILEPNLEVDAPVEQATVLPDPSGKLTATDIISGQHEGKFQRISNRSASLGISDTAWWVRFEATNPTEVPLPWVINFPFSVTDLVDFYVVMDGTVVDSYALGDKRPLANRVLPGEGFAIPVVNPPGKTITVLTRLHNPRGDGVDAYFEISSPRAYQEAQLHTWLFYGAIFGGILILLLYNTVIYAVIRERIYLWYLLYLFFAFASFITITGLGTQFIWSNRGALSEFFPPLFSSLALFFVVQFSRKFLDVENQLPRIDLALRGMMIYFTLPPLAFLLGQGSLAAILIMVGCLILTSLPVLGAYLWRQGQRAAFIFTLGWSVWFASIGLLAARIIGLAPTNDFTLRLAWVGILGEAVLFALALADRIRYLRHQRDAAEERERAALLRSKEELEAVVLERTRELAEQHEELRKTNNEKDKFFSIIAHDIRNPINGVIGLADMLSATIHEMSRTEVDECLRDLGDSARNLSKLLENLLSWALLQRGGLQLQSEPVPLDPLLDKCLGIYLPAAQQKHLKLRKGGEPHLIVYADWRMLETILRNLVNNAIKYSKPDGAVTLKAEREEENIVIAVSDEGVGMSQRIIDNLFNVGERTSMPGTQGERGTGLGLQLCYELIQRHGGRLEVESQPGVGSTFRIYLPAVEEE